jgi:glycosyltransferase involved in cell wall biosynthesis
MPQLHKILFTKMIMKICIVTHEFTPYTGQGRVNYEIAHYLAGQGHELYLLASEVAPNFQRYSNVHPLLVDIPEWVKTALLRNQVFALKSRSMLQQHQFDIIHANGSITYYRSNVNACHFVHSSWLKSDYHPCRSTLSISNIYQWFYSQLNVQWEQRAYRQANRVVAVSDFVKQSLIQDALVPAETIDVVWNGVDITEFRPIRATEENMLRISLRLNPTACIAFFTGDIKSNRKNLDLVLQALIELPENYCLVVAGAIEGSPYPAMVQALGLNHRVHFLGHRQDVSTLLRCADIFIFPSHYDPFALVVLEALASGIPIITVPTLGIAPMIQHGENGYLLANDYDRDGLVKILQELGKSPELRSRIGSMGRQTAEARSWQNMARQYEAIYVDVYQKQRNLDISPDRSLTAGSIQ